jgi:hypothetical protein
VLIESEVLSMLVNISNRTQFQKSIPSHTADLNTHFVLMLKLAVKLITILTSDDFMIKSLEEENKFRFSGLISRPMSLMMVIQCGRILCEGGCVPEDLA